MKNEIAAMNFHQWFMKFHTRLSKTGTIIMTRGWISCFGLLKWPQHK